MIPIRIRLPSGCTTFFPYPTLKVLCYYLLLPTTDFESGSIYRVFFHLKGSAAMYAGTWLPVSYILDSFKPDAW